MIIKKSLISFTSVLTVISSASAIEITSPTHAVDISGKQRMFTQRMLKDYAMVGMGNTFGKPEEDLKKISVTFQDHMDSLSSYTKSEEIKKSISELNTLWVSVQKVLLDTPSKEKVEKLQIDLETLLKLSDKITKQFAKESGKSSGETVNKAGRQRMLSQRMASLYMLKVWEVEDPQFDQKLKESMSLFKSSLSDLESSSLNTDDIKTILAKVKKSFTFFEMMSLSKSKFVPTLIYKKSNDILVNMNTATQKYVALETK